MLKDKLFVPVAICCALVCSASATELTIQSQGYDRSEEGFVAMGERVLAMHGRNLLARQGVRLFLDGRAAPGRMRELADADVGRCGAEGRVFLNGQPTVLAYYLGEPKTITELGVFSGNVDARGNQDFEIRVANNSQAAGTLPDFGKSPVFTTGPVVIGQNGGGFHTSFARKDGQPIVPEKVDWVEFRIWRTYNVKAGEPAHSANATGATVCLEFEVLGTEDDVILPSPAELARRKAFREAPKQPERFSKDTWEETLVANFESLFAWERLHDRLALPDVGLELDSWHVLGPLPEKSELVKQIRALDKIDLAAEYLGDDGKPLRWQERDTWTDGEVAEIPNVGKGQVVFACRNARFFQTLNRDELYLSVTADKGLGTILPERQRFSVRSPLEFSTASWEARLATGPRQILMELKGQADGPCRFFFLPQVGIDACRAGSASRRASAREGIVSGAKREFASSPEAMQINWEVRDQVWTEQGSRRSFFWLPGHPDDYLLARYRTGLQRRLAHLKTECEQREGIRAEVLAELRDQIVAWVDKTGTAVSNGTSLAEIRTTYRNACAVEELIDMSSRCRSMRLSVDDQQQTFADQDLGAASRLKELDDLQQRIDSAWDAIWTGSAIDLAGLRQLASEFDTRSRGLLTSNPLLQFDRMLVAEGGASFATNWGGPNRIGMRIVAISPTDPSVEPVVDSRWSGEFDRSALGREATAVLRWSNCLRRSTSDGTGLRQITADDGLMRYDPCYLADGNIVFAVKCVLAGGTVHGWG